MCEDLHSQKHGMNFLHDAAMNRKTMTICARSYDEKYSVKISSKSVKKCGREN